MGLKRFVLAVGLAVAGCEKTPPPQPPPQAQPPPDSPPPAATPPGPKADEAEAEEGPHNWVIHSGDGASTLRQKATAGDKCLLSCTKADGAEAREVWKSLGPCMAEKNERKFLAGNCERTVVMIPAPPRGKSWRETVVMRVYRRDKLDYPVMGVAVLADERLMKTSTSWLKGCYGVPGEAPRYSSDGAAVEYDSIDGQSRSVPLLK
jgi:hypothetical protein